MEFTDYDTRLAAYALILDERQERVLLSWYRGNRRQPPGWTLPGGGVEYVESLEEAVVREVREETGYDVQVGELLTTRTGTTATGPTSPRPFKSVQVVFDATIVGGELGTLEVGGSTEHAAWVELDEVGSADSRSPVIDVALAVRRR